MPGSNSTLAALAGDEFGGSMSLILWGMVPGPHPHVVRAFTHHDPWPTHPYALDRGHAQATAESAERSLRVLAGQSVDEAGKNASRNMHSQLKSLGYSLPIDIHPVEHCSEAGGNPNNHYLSHQAIVMDTALDEWKPRNTWRMWWWGPGFQLWSILESLSSSTSQDMLFFGTIWTT